MSDQNKPDQWVLISVSQTTTQGAQAPADNAMIESTLTTEDVAANADEGLIGFFAEELNTEMSEASDRAVESFPPDSVAARHPAHHPFDVPIRDWSTMDMRLEPSFGGGDEFNTPTEFMSPNPSSWPRFRSPVGMPDRQSVLPVTGLDPDIAHGRLLVLKVKDGETTYQALVEVAYARIHTISHQQLITAQVLPPVVDLSLRDIFPSYILTLEKQYAKRLFTIAPALFTLLFDNDAFYAKVECTDKHNVWQFHARTHVTNFNIQHMLQSLHNQLVSSMEFLSAQDGQSHPTIDLSKAGL